MPIFKINNKLDRLTTGCKGSATENVFIAIHRFTNELFFKFVDAALTNRLHKTPLDVCIHYQCHHKLCTTYNMRTS